MISTWRPALLGLILGVQLAAPLAAQLPRRVVRELDSLLDSAPFDRGLWGVALVDPAGRLLYGRNADKLFIPASNTKLVVSAVGAAMLPPGWTIPTSVYAAGSVEPDRVLGDLVLYGRGDPTFSRRCYGTDTTVAAACDRDPMQRLRDLARTLYERGIRTVTGDLVGDGSWFDAELVHGDWGSYDLNWWYAAPIAGLAFNDNSVDIAWRPGAHPGAPALLSLDPDLGDVTLENRTTTVPPGGESDIGDRMYRTPGTLHLWAEGTVAVDARGGTEYFALPDPNLYAARAFRRALEETGISVLGTTRSTTDSLAYRGARQGVPLAESTSRPLRDWIFPILNTSQNLFAEVLLKQLGRQFGAGGSWKEGLRVERRYLIDSMGIDSTLFALADGSGLSASNLVAPLGFTRLLQAIRRHPHFRENFEAGLPLSGSAGSLRSRFLGTPLEGRVRAKTGSISRVNTLSGYFELPDGRVYAFSVQANHHVQGSRRAIARIDEIVTAMARAVARGR
ncbi:MAG: D-alanyl-D-alanine carboxypeptidase/D-alanyl-D-alanine-endopeptidase [Gemmatimonadota bacterium]|nr:D-alanyl-D-alanine carboxypeptidase/D-alanyl-D-alanine-endopeptidase [Gemmatimonadota bacterium]